MTPSFLYFGYGSNLDRERLHIHCPSARFVGIARLEGHRLHFSIESKNTWKGGVANVLPHPESHVWGAVWEIDEEHAEHLDRQEGVFRDPPAYRRITVELETPEGERITCRSYQVVDPHPDGFRPSPAYRDTILRGARAIGLPGHYLAALEDIEHNGYEGEGDGPH